MNINKSIHEWSEEALFSKAQNYVTITEIGEYDDIIEKQNMKPSNFECVACGLKISGYSKLMHCGLADSFLETSSVDVRDYFNINTQ